MPCSGSLARTVASQLAQGLVGQFEAVGPAVPGAARNVGDLDSAVGRIRRHGPSLRTSRMVTARSPAWSRREAPPRLPRDVPPRPRRGRALRDTPRALPGRWAGQDCTEILGRDPGHASLTPRDTIDADRRRRGERRPGGRIRAETGGMEMAVETTSGRSAGVFSQGRARIARRTLRTDNWRREPRFLAVILIFFVVYSTVRIFMNTWYFVPQYNYLTPFYSPCISASCPEGAADFGHWLPDVPGRGAAGDPDLPVPAAVPADLLLLPQGLLPRRSGCRRRPARWPSRTARYTGETPVPADPAELPPVLLLRGRASCCWSTPTTRSWRSARRTAGSAWAWAR